MRRLIGALIKVDKVFKMFAKNDKILVGVSGGKDSTLLLMALNYFVKKINDKYKWNIKVQGVHIKINYFKVNYEPYKKWLKEQKLSVKFINSNVGKILKDKYKKVGGSQCSLCAKLKKAIMVKYALKYGFNKIATAHHIDDAIETLFMNMINEAKIATFNPISYLDRNDLYLIRPFILAYEKDTKALVKKLNIPIIVHACPNEFTTQRAKIKALLQKSFYQTNDFKASLLNFRNMLLNGKGCNLWFNKGKNQDLLKKLKDV